MYAVEVVSHANGVGERRPHVRRVGLPTDKGTDGWYLAALTGHVDNSAQDVLWVLRQTGTDCTAQGLELRVCTTQRHLVGERGELGHSGGDTNRSEGPDPGREPYVEVVVRVRVGIGDGFRDGLEAFPESRRTQEQLTVPQIHIPTFRTNRLLIATADAPFHEGMDASSGRVSSIP